MPLCITVSITVAVGASRNDDIKKNRKSNEREITHSVEMGRNNFSSTIFSGMTA